MQQEKKYLSRKFRTIFLIFLSLLGLFLATYKLTESPAVWFDEGVSVQTAMNLATAKTPGMQVEPGVIINATRFMTTGFPLIYPLSFSFKFFGVGMLQARIVMVIFLIGLILIAYLLVKKMFGFRTAVLSSLLLVSFPVLYGNGKNVLGEVPGLFFLVLFFFLFYLLEKSQFKKILYYVLTGLIGGLCVATKPIFLILLPAVFISALFFKKIVFDNWPKVLLGCLFFLLPLAIWLIPLVQQSGGVSEMISFYGNIQGVSDFSQAITDNLYKFITEASPAYFIILLIVWTVAIIIRIKSKTVIITEMIAFLFSWLVFFGYLSTAGFYRYFFPANVIALLFLPVALSVILNYLNGRWSWVKNYKLPLVIMPMVLLLLIVHFFQLGFNSWVANYYHSQRTQTLSSYLKDQDPADSIFFYNVPEAVVFLPHRNYYQYAALTPVAAIGQEQLIKLTAGVPDKIMTVGIYLTKKEVDFSHYQIKDEVDRYLILEKVR